MRLVTLTLAIAYMIAGPICALQQPIRSREMLLSRVRQAMELSQQLSNVTAAEQACGEWHDLLQSPLLPSNVRGLSLAMQASCLVRVGRDTEALTVYDEALALVQDPATVDDLRIGKATSLQRLLRYQAAYECFAFCGHRPQALEGAVTCLLRLGDLAGAQRVIQKSHVSVKSVSSLVDVIMSESSRLTRDDAALSPLHWLMCGEKPPRTDHSPSFDFMDFVAVNIGPFDDPLLVHLDDKIWLHQLLTGSESQRFWPRGLVLPHEASFLSMYSNDTMWISKQRAGYGSHGHQLLNTTAAAATDQNDPLLLQQLVQPPLLLNGYKFSLRVYVIYFTSIVGPPPIYVARNGLVKLAAWPLEAAAVNDPQVHLTNSGRDEAMRQEDFGYLDRMLQKQGLDFADLWQVLTDAVRSVFAEYVAMTTTQDRADPTMHLTRGKLAQLGIPKILGLDFVLDATGHPWLVEVNRFPGLEPRNEQDAAVKQNVIRNAWMLACERQGWKDTSWIAWPDTLISNETCGVEAIVV